MFNKKFKLKPQFGVLTIILLIAIAVLIAADLLTKHFEEKYDWSLVIIRGFIEISHDIKNQGCAFSFLNNSPAVGQPLLITATLVMLVFMIAAFIFMPNKMAVLKIAVSLIIAGAVGNLVDRFIYLFENIIPNTDIMGGGVRDWFGLWMFGGMTYCNLADFWIVIGVALAVVDLMFLNEWAVIPLTKKAKAAQAARKAQEEAEKAAQTASADTATAESNISAPENNTVAEESTQNNTDNNE